MAPYQTALIEPLTAASCKSWALLSIANAVVMENLRGRKGIWIAKDSVPEGR
jgi:hypothetical protein